MQSMRWSDKPLSLMDPATSDEHDEVLAHLLEICPHFDMRRHGTSIGIRHCPELVEHLRVHSRAGQYVFQYMREPVELPALAEYVEGEVVGADAVAPAIAPDPADIATVSWLPAPVATAALPAHLWPRALEAEAEGKLFAPFQVAPDYTHAPSLAARAGAAEEKATKQGTRATWVREVIACQECYKPRAVFCEQAPSTVQMKLAIENVPSTYVSDQIDMLCEDESQFISGSVLFPRGHKLNEHVYVNQALSCADAVEQALYGTSDSTRRRIEFSKQLCSVCADELVPSDDCKEQGCAPSIAVSKWVQYPLCDVCVDAGKITVRISRKQPVQGAKRAVRAVKRKRKPVVAAVVVGSASESGTGSESEPKVQAAEETGEETESEKEVEQIEQLQDKGDKSDDSSD